MKKVSVLLTVLGFGILISCNDNNELIGDQNNDNQNQEQEKTFFKLDFENNSEAFVTNAFGDHVVGEPVIDLVQVQNNTCGTLYRGKTEDFTQWKGYDFKGNNTQFLGLDMGACKGYFDAVVETNIKIKTSISKGAAKMAFKYYMPGDFTGWNSGYFFNVYLDKKNADYENGDSLQNALQQFKVNINPDGWVDFSENLAVDLPAGEYKIIVQIIGSSAAIDDIRLIDNN